MDDSAKRKAESSAESTESASKKLKATAGPAKKKKLFSLTFADHGSKGRRKTMEDEHIVWTNDEIHSAYPALPPTTRLSFFGIYDGHGGVCTVKFVRERLHLNIVEGMIELLSKKTTEIKKQAKLLTKPDVVKTLLAYGFKKTEEEVKAQGTEKSWKDGCCVVLMAVVNNVAYICNLGDSKAVLCRQTDTSSAEDASGGAKAKGSYKGSSTSISLPASEAIKAAPAVDAKCLTREYTCKLAAEKQRIEAAGGRIENGRVNGIMEVSRSFGDLALKRFGVTSEPDLRVHFKIGSRDEFMLIACDGLWERYNKDMAVKFVRERIIAHETFVAHTELHTKDCIYPEQRWDLKKICCDLVDDAINDKGGQDNTSVMVVRFGPPPEEPAPPAE